MLPTFAVCGQSHFSLHCKGCGSPVETSAFNAEAPTEPAGETVGCRRQLGGIVRLILYEFIKIPQSFFCFKKTTAPFTREPLTDNCKGCPYGMIYNSIRAIIFYHTISLIQIIYFLIMQYRIIICKLCSAFSFA